MFSVKPNKVKIVTPNELLSVNKAQLHRCETTGSYPPARIIWLLGGKPVTNAVITVRPYFLLIIPLAGYVIYNHVVLNKNKNFSVF